MNNLFVILTSVSSSVSTSESNVTSTPHVYTLTEAIVYYSIFIIVVALFILFIIRSGTKKKVLTRKINALSRDSKKYLDLIKKYENNKIDKFTVNKKIYRSILVLNQFDSSFQEYKEKTRLDDFDKLQEQKEIVVTYLKELEKKDNLTLDDLKDAQLKIASLKGQIDLVWELIKH